MKPKQDPVFYQDKVACLQHLQALENEGHIELYFGDESGFSLLPVVPYGWQFKGEPISICPKVSRRLNTFGILNKDNRLRVFEAPSSIDACFVVSSIEDWLSSLTKISVLVLDNGGAHRNKLLSSKIEQWQEKGLYIFFLPPYSPHLNKIEILWRKIKYEWLKPSHYLSVDTLKQGLKTIFDQFGNQFSIKFKTTIL